jgi:hypothetical protein
MTTRQTHARRIVAAISDIQRTAVTARPLDGIERLGYTAVPEPALTSKRGAGGMCDGLSFAENGTVMFAPTPGSKRENFTLLHEIAHILVERDQHAMIWLADRPDPSVELERLCEEIAADLLIPESLVDDVVGSGPITGEDLKALVARSAASGPACAIALSNRLSSGAVVIIDRAIGRVVHSALRGDNLIIYPWKSTDVPDNHPLLALQAGDMATRKTFWSDAWNRRQEYYVSAIATEKRVYAVFSTSDLWGVEAFHGGSRPTPKSNAPRLAISCHCGYVGMAFGWPCGTCKRQYCPKCDECDCQRRDRAHGTCTKCLLQAPDLENGVCSECR